MLDDGRMAQRQRETTVLIVEDEVEFRLLLRVLLDRSTDCRVIAEAADGAEAIRKAEQHRPDLILLDVHMPKGDGLSAVPHLDRASPGSTVIVVSSDPDTRGPASHLGLRWVDKARLMSDLPPLLNGIARD